MRHDLELDLVRDIVLEHGWCVQFVGYLQCEPGCGGHACGADPPFACTIGLTRHRDHPEVILFGACLDCASRALDSVAHAVRNGRDVTDPSVLDDLFGRGAVQAIPVADSSTHLTMANAMYRATGAPPIPAVQLVMSSSDGRFPWNAGYLGDRTRQPLLDRAS
jgi:hypothetical protein